MAWCRADPRPGEREAAAGLPARAREAGAPRDGMIVLADKGLAGREIESYAADLIGVLLARPDRTDERRRFGNLARHAAVGRSNHRHPQRPASPGTTRRTDTPGVLTRIAQRPLALATCSWNNWRTSPKCKRSLIRDH